MFQVGQLVMFNPSKLGRRELPLELAGIPLRVTRVDTGTFGTITTTHLQVSIEPQYLATLPPHTYTTGWLEEFYLPYPSHLYRRHSCPST